MGKYYLITMLAFAVTLYYVLLGSSSEGTKVVDQLGCHAHEKEAFIKFKSGLNDPYNMLHSWDLGEDCCTWRGVACDNQTGYVLGLSLTPSTFINESEIDYWSKYLSGRLDPSLLELKHLQWLDLSRNSFDGIQIPKFFGSFSNLKYLNLSDSGFIGPIPKELGNLSKLEHLDLSNFLYKYRLSTDSLQWLKGMPLLRELSMINSNLSQLSGNDWIDVLNNLPTLQTLSLISSILPAIPAPSSSVNLTSLKVLQLSLNFINSEIPPWLTNISNLEILDLSENLFYGSLPRGFSELLHLESLSLPENNVTDDCSEVLKGSWPSLRVLDLSQNTIYGELPAWVSKPCNKLCCNPETIPNCNASAPLSQLKVLYLWRNKLQGSIPKWVGKIKSLEELNLGLNKLSGSIPVEIGQLSSLRSLSLESNLLNGSIPPSTWSLSRLEFLQLSNNSLEGVIDDSKLEQLKNLTYLDLSSNPLLLLRLPNDWVPPFQLNFLDLDNLKLGPHIPRWIETQRSLFSLHLSNTFINGVLPSWFWPFISNSSIGTLDLSLNMIKGRLPNTLSTNGKIPVIDLSFNQFSGPIPHINRPVFKLDLSNNQLSGPIDPLFNTTFWAFGIYSIAGNQISGKIPESICQIGFFGTLDLSRNHLNGGIPASLGNCTYIEILDLSENFLVGEVPRSLNMLANLRSLHLGRNMLSGTIPLLTNCSNLDVLDLGYNYLSGGISHAIERLGSVRILRLQANMFTGKLPSNMSHMVSLQILDLAENKLSGSIPRSIGELLEMTQNHNSVNNLYDYGRPWEFRELETLHNSRPEKSLLSLNGHAIEYDMNLYLVVGINFSSNGLGGEIPQELMRLKRLLFLDLSRNHFTGEIPKNIHELQYLENLDLSNNQFRGEIPPSLSELTFLVKLNLSYNQLQGRIPTGNQLQNMNDSSIYAGNLDLCGAPLPKQCSSNKTVEVEQGRQNGMLGFYMSMALGVVVGFWGSCGLLIFKPSMRILYFKFFDDITEKLVTAILLCLAKLKIRITKTENHEKGKGNK